MDHSCYKCGQSVEDGVPFCAHCGAPQIRVVVAEPAVASDLSRETDSSSHALDVPRGKFTAPGISGSMTWSHVLRPCALAALVAVLLMGLRLYPFVAMIGAGVLAVAFYRQRNPGTAITAGAGARLGAVSGLLWFGMLVILAALVAASHSGSEIRDQVLRTMQQTAAGSTDPQVLAALDYAKTPGGFAVLIILSLIIALFASILLATLGGALVGAIFGRRNRQ